MADTTDTTIPPEVWKPVVGFDGFYEVSDLGRVRSLDRCVSWIDRLGRVTTQTRKGRVLALSAIEGYPAVVLHDNRGGRQNLLVHRLVLLAFVGRPKADQETRHVNGNRKDARLVNLAWGTAQQNAEDRIAHKTVPKGSQHYRAMVTADDVGRMRRLRETSPLTYLQLGAIFGLTENGARSICVGKNWANVPQFKPAKNQADRAIAHASEVANKIESNQS